MSEKKCNKCGEVKPVSEFHKSKYTKSGFNSLCKPCRSEARKIVYTISTCIICGQLFQPERSDSKYCKNKKCKRKYSYENEKINPSYKTSCKAYQAKYRAENRTELSKKKSEYQKLNWDKRYTYQREWIKENKIHLRMYRNKKKEHINDRDREIKNDYMRRSRIHLYDSYLKNLISRNSELKCNDIPQPLIEAYRLNLQLKRLIKQL